MTYDNNFMGKNGFVWWFGRVEDNGDPMGVGRCRVRIDGWHSEDVEAVPTETLPWAYPIMPITSANVGGVGTTPVGPAPGTRVFGFFLDGLSGMSPVMIGTIGGARYIDDIGGPVPQPGSTASYPLRDDLIAPTVDETDDCPEGYPASTSVNLSLPDPRNLQYNKSEWAIPFTGFVSSAYGERGGKHYGVDICPGGIFKQTQAGAPHVKNTLLGPAGLPVYAAADGEVVFIWTADKGSGGRSSSYDKTGTGSRSYGNGIAIRHKLSTGTYTTIYSHLGVNQDPAKDKPGAGVNVKVGDKVKKGQQIGSVGRTHNRNQLTHLHFEIRMGEALPRNSNHINPGRIFPQLTNRHKSLVDWCACQIKYDAEPQTLPDDAPVKAFEGPR